MSATPPVDRRKVVYDRRDRRFLVPAPASFRGWTFNLGHPLAWVMIAAIVILPLAVVAVVLFR